jgi:photosystem II stability/assembly factor-like uncharacterized protein
MKTLITGGRLLAALALVALTPVLAGAQSVPGGILDKIDYRSIGPTAQGGRFVDFALPLQQPHVIYAASASGGLWKSENRGRTFTSLLDQTDIISLGDVEVAPSDPNIVWIGTGEGNNSRSVYYGNGVWKSVDAGTTWTHMGLEESQHIGRIVIHPRDPNIVYVAALGHLYSDNPERGLYKTTDGGKNWTKCLSVKSEGRDIGVVDVVMDPSRPNTLYAAAYDKVRRPWTFNEAGPGSGIYKSTDAGRNWSKLEGELPSGMLGRIGLAVAPKNPNTVYAVIENANSEGVPVEERRQELLEGRPPRVRTIGNEIYRSDNGGRAWKKVNEQGSVGGDPPYYYGQLRVDPNDTEHLYNLGVGVTQSTDGGKTWRSGFRFGGDNHALWIDPADSKHMLLGHDHGMGITYDGGQNWYRPDILPLAQYYAVAFDMEYPYNVYGGLQDNGSVRGPSTRRGRGFIPFEEWYGVGGGDGMYNVVDPSDSRWLYNESQFGPLRRLDQKTGESRSIRYNRGEGQDALRWNWNAPILISPHDSNVIFHGANILLRSPFRGEQWEEISPDLTTNDPAKIQGTGNIQYCTITTIDESPVIPGVLWVGTDDGNVQLSRDGGANWTLMNEKIPGQPGYWVSRVTASFHDPAVAYVTFTGMRRDDFRPFVYKTTDYGETWTSIVAGLPNESVNVIREDRRNPNLLFAGTDKAVYVSLDGGARWNSLRNDMPAVPVHDLQIHPRENDLIVGTHGRSAFIADISALQELTAETMTRPFHLFRVEPKIRWTTGITPETASQNFAGESEPTDALINYWLKADAGEVKVRIFAGERLIREFDGEKAAGLNQLRWNLMGTRERTPQEKEAFQRQPRRGAGGAGGGGGGGAPAGFPGAGQQRGDPEHIDVPMPPGEYRVVLSVDGREMSTLAVIMPDHWAER